MRFLQRCQLDQLNLGFDAKLLTAFYKIRILKDEVFLSASEN
jgi:hypothetical protein